MHSWDSQDLWLPFLLSAISRKGVPSLPLSPPPVVKDSPQDPGCCWREPGLSHTTGMAGYSLPTLLPPRKRVPPLGTSAWCSASLGTGDTRKASLTTPSAVTKLCLVCYVLFLLFLEWCAGLLCFVFVVSRMVCRTTGLLQILSHARVSAQVSTLQLILFFLVFQSQQEWDLGRFTGRPRVLPSTLKSVCLLLGVQVGGPPRSCNSHKGAFVDGYLFCCFEMRIKRGLFYAAITPLTLM